VVPVELDVGAGGHVREPAGTSETVTVPLDTFGCDASALTEVHDVLIFLSAGNFAIDRLTLS